MQITRGRRSGFATIELPIVLAALALLGLAAIAIYRLFAGRAPWYVWLVGPVVPPALVIALGAFGAWIEIRYMERKRKAAERDSN